MGRRRAETAGEGFHKWVDGLNTGYFWFFRWFPAWVGRGAVGDVVVGESR